MQETKGHRDWHKSETTVNIEPWEERGMSGPENEVIL